jgi:HEAT repeat protein
VRVRCLLSFLAVAAGVQVRAAPLLAAPSGKLASGDPSLVYQAIEEIRAAKDLSAATNLFETGIATAYPHLAIACGEALAALGADSKEGKLGAAVGKASRSKEERLQKSLARVLGAWGHAGVDEPLAYLATGRRPVDVQAEALSMCGNLKIAKESPFTRVVDAVEAGLRARTPEVQVAACSAAGRLGLQRFEEALSTIVRKSQAEYPGLYAVWALSRIGRPGDVPAYAHVLGAPSADRRTVQACLKGVAALARPEHVSDLLSMTRQSDQDQRDAAVVAIGRLASEQAFAKEAVRDREGVEVPVSKVVDRLVELVATERSWEVRDAAARALRRIGEPAKAAVAERLAPLVDASVDDVAITAMELCGEFQVEAAFRDVLKASHLDKVAVRRLFAARAAGTLAPERAAKELLAGLEKDRRGAHAKALARALGYVPHEAAFTGLVALLGSEGHADDVLREVEFALERMTGHRFGRKPERWNKWWERAKDRNPFHFSLGKFDRSRNRSEAKEKRLFGLTETTEQAVEAGLRWLELQQHPDGSWDGNEKGFGGVVGCEPAYTGLSLLAFLGAGYNGREGKYHESVRRSSEFLAATQFYDGGYPVTGGGDDSWIFAYLVGMAVWGVNEAYGLSGDEVLRRPAQAGLDYLVRVQTPGSGWRYGPRYTQSDTSCTSWVLMTVKTGSLLGLEVPQKCLDGIDSWLERCSSDVTGQEELPEDLMTAYEQEVGVKKYYQAFTSYLTLSENQGSGLQQTSMTAVGMVCRFFMGWKRSHPFLIGSANYLMNFLPQWRKGLEKGQAVAWYFYYWYYGTLAMHQMGGRYWRAWNEKIKTMLPENQRRDPEDMVGSWDPDSAVLNGGRIFSTAMAILSLETYYRFSPLLEDVPDADPAAGKRAPDR